MTDQEQQYITKLETEIERLKEDNAFLFHTCKKMWALLETKLKEDSHDQSADVENQFRI